MDKKRGIVVLMSVALALVLLATLNLSVGKSAPLLGITLTPAPTETQQPVEPPTSEPPTAEPTEAPVPGPTEGPRAGDPEILIPDTGADQTGNWGLWLLGGGLLLAGLGLSQFGAKREEN